MNTCVCVRAYGHQTNKRADRKEEIKTLLRWAREARKKEKVFSLNKSQFSFHVRVLISVILRIDLRLVVYFWQ